MTRRFLGPRRSVRAATSLLLCSAILFGPGCLTDPAVKLSHAHERGHDCASASAANLHAAAGRNAQGLYRQPVDLFGRKEAGWAVYAPAVEHEVDALCRADSPGFAQAVADWSARHGGANAGVLTADLLARMKDIWQAKRPFVQLRARNMCPPPPQDSALATAPAEDSYGGKIIQLRKGALAAWLRLVRDARRAEPEIGRNPQLLTIFSAYRSPGYDAARCARENNCQGVVRAACSAHRTGLAMDVVLDTAPGLAVDSSADANRLAMTRGLAYRWLVANAARYGFVNYVFEPWHWEWTGERV